MYTCGYLLRIFLKALGRRIQIGEQGLLTDTRQAAAEALADTGQADTGQAVAEAAITHSKTKRSFFFEHKCDW